MKKSIRHLRGDSAEWQRNDIIVPDGEIALLRTAGGRTVIKVGDGRHTFSDLHSVGGDVSKEGGTSITLRHGTSYRLGKAYLLNLTFPTSFDDDYYCEISFDSPDNPTELVFTGTDVRFTGDGVADGEFMPDSNMHYTVFIWYDGCMQGVVRGIPNA